jgi:hypothetical protein
MADGHCQGDDPVRRSSRLSAALGLFLTASCVLPELQLAGSVADPIEVAPSPAVPTPAAEPSDASATTQGVSADASQPMAASISQATLSSAGQSATAGVGVAGSVAANRAAIGGAMGTAGSSTLQLPCTGGLACLVLGATCTADPQCASGSCMKQCRMPTVLGTTCDSKADCVAPLECSRLMLCQRGMGQSCTADSECASGSCLDVCYVTQAAGGACNSAADCNPHNPCVSQLCRGELDQPCTRDASCMSGYCSPYAKVCLAPGADTNLADGTPCVDDEQCSSGSCYRSDLTSTFGACRSSQ